MKTPFVLFLGITIAIIILLSCGAIQSMSWVHIIFTIAIGTFVAWSVAYIWKKIKSQKNKE